MYSLLSLFTDSNVNRLREGLLWRNSFQGDPGVHSPFTLRHQQRRRRLRAVKGGNLLFPTPHRPELVIWFVPNAKREEGVSCIFSGSIEKWIAKKYSIFNIKKMKSETMKEGQHWFAGINDFLSKSLILSQINRHVSGHTHMCMDTFVSAHEV